MVIEETDVVQCKKCKHTGKLSGAEEAGKAYYCPNCNNKIAIKQDGKILSISESTFAFIDCTSTPVQ